MSARPILDPASEEVIAEVEDRGPVAVDEAVRAAAAAQREWAAASPRWRSGALSAFAHAVAEDVEELARLETANVGKTIRDSRADAAMAADTLAYFAGAADKHHGETIPAPGGLSVTLREPIGVAGLIVPWNFPLAITSWKLAPALACGNAALIKPSELTPLTALRLADLALAAGLPEGLVAVLPGGSETGAALVAHPGVGKVSFTGSTAVGARIAAAAAPQIKRVSLELGGKSANLVFADADLERAAAAAPEAAFLNAGQNCCARSRILVERSVLDRFVELFAANAAALRVGPPADERTDVGPLINAKRRHAVAAMTDGAAVAWRGAVPEGPGFWSAPTLLGPTDNAAPASREEIFGPVTCVIPFGDEREAVAIANDTPYGLAGSVWTRDSGRALRVAMAIQAGVLSVNSNDSVRVGAPFGGYKQSGFGRELGIEAMADYSESKAVFLATS